MKWEYDAAGIAWPSFAERAGRVAATLDEMDRVFGSDGYPEGAQGREFFGLPVQAPVQRRADGRPGPPLILGGTGDRILALAARRADTVALAGAFQVRGQPPGTFRLGTAEEAAERVRFVREQAGDRFEDLELNVLVQAVVITGDRQATAAELAAERFAPFTPEEVLDTPFLLIGTIDEIADQLRERRERYGFSFITVHEPFMRDFAPVIGRVRAG
jgi:probable F420-dependent oxidoreductase